MNPRSCWPALARIGLLVGATAGTLAACTVGPRYTPPATPPSAAGRFASSAPAIASSDQPQPEWWRLYNVPVVDQLVQEALTHNKNLLVAAANLTEARAALSLARAGRYPATTLSAGASYGVSSTAASAAGLSGGGAVNPTGLFTAGLDVSYEADLFGRIHRTVQAAAANYQAEQAAEDVVRITVAAETTRAYVNACAYAEEGGVAQQSLSIVQQTYDVTVKEAQAGAASDFDVARAASQLEQSRASLPAYEGQRRTALFELAVLTGRPPEEVSEAANACKAPPKLARALPVGDGASLFRRRPDVREADRLLAADIARIGVATADLYPTITIGGAAATASTTLGGLTSSRSLTYSLAPALTWSFPNTLVAQAEIREARATASASLASFQATVLQALQDTEEALTSYGAELDRNASLVAAGKQSQIAFNLAQVRFQAGSASFLDVLSAQSDYINSRSALAASDQALASDQVTVFKALGGGWERAPDITPLPIPDGHKRGDLIKVH